jgi:hypothetical protein
VNFRSNPIGQANARASALSGQGAMSMLSPLCADVASHLCVGPCRVHQCGQRSRLRSRKFGDAVTQAFDRIPVRATIPIAIHYDGLRSGGSYEKKACCCAARSCHSVCGHMVGGYTRIRVRRLRSKRPSQWVRSLRLRRSKSGLVHSKDGPCSHPHARWDDALSVRQGTHDRQNSNLKSRLRAAFAFPQFKDAHARVSHKADMASGVRYAIKSGPVRSARLRVGSPRPDLNAAPLRRGCRRAGGPRNTLKQDRLP